MIKQLKCPNYHDLRLGRRPNYAKTCKTSFMNGPFYHLLINFLVLVSYHNFILKQIYTNTKVYLHLYCYSTLFLQIERTDSKCRLIFRKLILFYFKVHFNQPQDCSINLILNFSFSKRLNISSLYILNSILRTEICVQQCQYTYKNFES